MTACSFRGKHLSRCRDEGTTRFLSQRQVTESRVVLGIMLTAQNPSTQFLKGQKMKNGPSERI